MQTANLLQHPLILDQPQCCETSFYPEIYSLFTSQEPRRQNSTSFTETQSLMFLCCLETTPSSLFKITEEIIDKIFKKKLELSYPVRPHSFSHWIEKLLFMLTRIHRACLFLRLHEVLHQCLFCILFSD